MKYKRLSKEQFDALHQEFATFLATQTIDKKEWDDLKANKPEVAEQELDVFSDLIWEGVLSNTRFLEHFSKNYIFLFHCQEILMHSIIIKTHNPDVDLLTKEGLQWLGNHLFTENVSIHLGKKEYENVRNEAIFNIINEGAILSDGQLYLQINTMLQN